MKLNLQLRDAAPGCDHASKPTMLYLSLCCSNACGIKRGGAACACSVQTVSSLATGIYLRGICIIVEANFNLPQGTLRLWCPEGACMRESEQCAGICFRHQILVLEGEHLAREVVGVGRDMRFGSSF